MRLEITWKVEVFIQISFVSFMTKFWIQHYLSVWCWMPQVPDMGIKASFSSSKVLGWILYLLVLSIKTRSWASVKPGFSRGVHQLNGIWGVWQEGKLCLEDHGWRMNDWRMNLHEWRFHSQWKIIFKSLKQCSVSLKIEMICTGSI